MANLRINFAGIRSPNPFWLASAPPTNSGAQIHRAFEAGWGGAVWKTIGAPVLNVSNRYGSWRYGTEKMLAINNVELIADRPMEVNLREIAEVKRAWPDRAVIVSAMVESKPEAWHDVIRRIQDTGADGIELNYGCPHGMSERGMGSAVGQVPEYCQEITGWVMDVAKIPVIVKLTPNISDIVMPARAAVAAGANAISLINTINSIMGVDLDTLDITPSIGGRGGHGGYAGPAVKPIALNMLAALGRDSVVHNSSLPISGMGGISTWRDAAEFLLLGASSLQICTAVMHYGFRIIEDLCDGLSNWMDAKQFATIPDIVGHSLRQVSDFKDFDLSFKVVALIDKQGHVIAPAVYEPSSNGRVEAVSTRPSVVVREDDCVGCRLCFNICPVENCIQMVEVAPDRPSVTWDELTAKQPEVAEDWDQMERYRQKMGIRIH